MNIRNYRFLTDENIDPNLVNFLRSEMLDVFDVKENNLVGSKDTFLLDLAYKANRVLVTCDSDFGTLIYKQHHPFLGLIYLRPGHFDYRVHVQSLQAILKISFVLEEPFIIIADWSDSGVKIRIKNKVELL